jgi:hypothetical protein
MGARTPKPRAPVRILLVSDLHYALPQFDWVVDHAPDFDLVVVAGGPHTQNTGVGRHGPRHVIDR